ncbi:TonB family protein [Ruegeria sp.]|uniref:energy transducer TonB family protein n=1 Tax=Ruegeria sp. TaxID=1879320 RepID=UPI003B5CF878
MIRRSLVIAVIAVLLSLVLHAMGLRLTAPNLTEQPGRDEGPDSVELGNSFEELVDAVAEPVEPEPEAAPDPPVEEPPEPAPEPAEIPTSEVHVASDNPEQTFAPDTGESEVLRPLELEPVQPEPPVTESSSEGEQTASDAEDETPTAESAEVTEIPEGTPEAAETVEDVSETADPAPTEPEVVAEAPEATEPAETSTVPVVPLESEVAEAEVAVTPSEPVPDQEVESQQQALTSSIRPKLADRRPQTDSRGALSSARDFSDLRFPTRQIESPLTTYRRRGVDAFTSGDSGTQSGGRNPGNSDRTNYAGQVLIHLNRAPIVYTAARGFAKVFFQINPDGTLAWVDVVDSNGTPDVERAAKAQVRAASPFPKPPGGVSRKLSFVYSSN